MGRARILLLFLLLIFLTGTKTYAPLQDLNIQKEQGSLVINERLVDYFLYINEAGYTKDWLVKNLVTVSEKFQKFADSKNYSSTDCRLINKINIFIVDTEILNDKQRFNKYQEVPEDREIWALFDQMKDDPEYVSIILTNHGSYNLDLLTHELAHYWSYRFCWDIFYFDLDGEQVALEFESFAKEN